MDFEFDVSKSEGNLAKHGISFDEARELWAGPGVEFPTKSEYEPRMIRVALWRGRPYSCIYTMRKERARIISVRRSRPMEEAFYWRSLQDEEKDEKNQR